MGDDSPAVVLEPRYRAFISYSHADTRFAGWLHRKLESWRMPDKTRLAPVFIDRAELAAGSDLSAQVRDALAGSAALVVVCSANARASRWVGQEIALFRKLHPDRPVLAALIDGEPDAAFPEPLLEAAGQKLEPLAADFREGQDGRRLGLIKLVAGLTGQPLDRLVQRDAQNRQRRVMAVTAGALLLVLILSASLIFALRARAEAERQRAEAEGLVEFMLTDLRDRLKGVGNLDVMDAVNTRAMQYYGDDSSLDGLGADSLNRRARVIEAMGTDDESRGKFDAAYAKYRELHRVTETLLAHDPENSERIFAHARSENRLGLIEVTRGNQRLALPRFTSAKRLLGKLAGKKGNPQWQELDSLVTGNLCAMTVKSGGSEKAAIEFCRQAIQGAGQRGDSGLYDLAFHYLWLGDAASAAGDKVLARDARRMGLEASNKLIALDPKNWFWLEQHAEVCLHLAKAAASGGDLVGARSLAKTALADAERLVRHDPENNYWTKLRRQIGAFTRENFR